MIDLKGLSLNDITFNEQNQVVITNASINKQVREVLGSIDTLEWSVKIKKISIDISGIEIEG
ncbi:hypothetical protein ACSBQ0_18355 [Bacillus altitudinis]|uniref:hypothetical protein n=1 Tax=Bacillus TaxID=1386 RepID=UPI001BD08A12|nr:MULTISPECIES: hypothetical protein [Bacillus]MCM3353117.1 hypothetical protein [Bacillus halotolerans]QVN29348.1 hypothetical protein JYG31_09225 [Bacillus halotolerans]